MEESEKREETVIGCYLTRTRLPHMVFCSLCSLLGGKVGTRTKPFKGCLFSPFSVQVLPR